MNVVGAAPTSIFLNENFWISNNISLTYVPYGPIDNIGTDSRLSPKRWQAIIWTNDGIVYWRIYASLGLNELRVTLKCYNKTKLPEHSSIYPIAANNPQDISHKSETQLSSFFYII